MRAASAAAARGSSSFRSRGCTRAGDSTGGGAGGARGSTASSSDIVIALLSEDDGRLHYRRTGENIFKLFSPGRMVCWTIMQSAREKPHFPPIEAASPDGVLFVGGSLAPDWMLEAYRRGIFPMPIKIDRRRLIAWLAPDPRGVLEIDSLYISRRLARRL